MKLLFMPAMFAIPAVVAGAGMPSTGHAASAILIDSGTSGHSETGSWTLQGATNNSSGGSGLMISGGFPLEIISEPSGVTLAGLGLSGLLIRHRRVGTV